MTGTNVGARLILITLSTTLTLVVVELALRAFGNQAAYTTSQYPKTLFDPGSPSNLRPGFIGHFPRGELYGEIVINSHGLRDPERPYETSGRPRILSLDDSFAFGHGVPATQSYPARLETLLRHKRPDFEVINAGSPGQGPASYAHFLEEEGLRYQPDLILVGIFIGNDIVGSDFAVTDVDGVRPADNADPKGTSDSAPHRPRGSLSLDTVLNLKGWLRTHLHLYSFIVDRLKETPATRGLLQRAGIASGVIGSYVIDVLRSDYPPAIHTQFERVFAIFDQMLSHGTPVVIILIPTREQVDDARRATALAQVGYHESEIDIHHPNRLILEYCDRRNIECIDLLPCFRILHDSQKHPLFFEIDPHFNRQGHELAADLIYESVIASETIRRRWPWLPGRWQHNQSRSLTTACRDELNS